MDSTGATWGGVRVRVSKHFGNPGRTEEHINLKNTFKGDDLRLRGHFSITNLLIRERERERGSHISLQLTENSHNFSEKKNMTI